MKEPKKTNLKRKELGEHAPGATRKQVLEALKAVIQAKSKSKKETKTSAEPPVPA
jgi:hypothetical protein